MKTNSGTPDNKAFDTAKAFFEREWNDPSIKLHSECVIEACLDMATHTDLNTDIFMIAGWLHDLGRKIDKDTHHLISVDFIKAFLTHNPAFHPLEAELVDCIKHHRRTGTPTTLYGLIFQCADKVALHHTKWLQYAANKEDAHTRPDHKDR